MRSGQLLECIYNCCTQNRAQVEVIGIAGANPIMRVSRAKEDIHYVAMDTQPMLWMVCLVSCSVYQGLQPKFLLL